MRLTAGLFGYWNNGSDARGSYINGNNGTSNADNNRGGRSDYINRQNEKVI